MLSRKTIGLILFNAILIYALLEISLRTSHFDYLKNYGEINGGKYQSPFFHATEGWYYVTSPYYRHEFVSAEFRDSFCYNNEGLRDMDHTIEKPGLTKRYIALGDSYTEGVGVEVDSTWWRLLEDIENKTEDSVRTEIINGGAMGSDICFGYALLRDRLIKYNPNVVFYMLNVSDYEDVALRGGMERFKADGSIDWRMCSPWWEFIYKYSYVLRAFIYHCITADYFFRSKTQLLQDEQHANKRLAETIDSLNTFCISHNSHFILLIQPCRNEILNRTYRLQPIVNYCRLHKIRFINLFDAFWEVTDTPTETLNQKYFWPIDRHCNGDGYNFFAQQIHNRLDSVLKQQGR